MNKSFLGQVYIFVGSSLGYLIGGGFMSGQEALQYYVPFGYYGVFTALTFSTIIILVNLGFIYAGKYGHCKKGNEVYSFFCGSFMARVLEWFSVAFCFSMFVAEIAAGGSVLHEQYGLPLVVGAIFTVVITAVTVSIGLNSVLKSLGVIMPFLTLFVIVIASVTVYSNFSTIPDNVVAVETHQYNLLQVAPNWFLSGLGLVGLMVLFLSSFSADLATKFPIKPLMIGQSIGLFLYGLLDMFSAYPILSTIDTILDKQIINLYLAQSVWAPLGMAFGVLIFFAIYTICTPLVYVLGAKFATEGTKKHKIIIWGVSFAALWGAVVFPFNQIINIVYIVSGYVGIFIVLLMIVKFVRILLARRRMLANEQRGKEII